MRFAASLLVAASVSGSDKTEGRRKRVKPDRKLKREVELTAPGKPGPGGESISATSSTADRRPMTDEEQMAEAAVALLEISVRTYFERFRFSYHLGLDIADVDSRIQAINDELVAVTKEKDEIRTEQRQVLESLNQCVGETMTHAGTG